MTVSIMGAARHVLKLLSVLVAAAAVFFYHATESHVTVVTVLRLPEFGEHDLLPPGTDPVDTLTAAACFVIVGPVIGLVTSSTARILLETTHAANLNVSLRDGNGAGHSVAQSLEALSPTALEFIGLEPDTEYFVDINGCTSRQYQYVQDTSGAQVAAAGRVHTFPSGWSYTDSVKAKSQALSLDEAGARFAIISCNMYNASFFRHQGSAPAGKLISRADMWQHVQQLVEAKSIDIAFHIGDQVYVDTGRHRGPSAPEAFMDSIPRQDWPQQAPHLQNMYKALYHRTWSYPPTAYVLASVSNLMIYDDHEVRDDLGDRLEDSDPDSVEFFIHLQARDVMRLYQKQLHSDELDGPDYHSHKIGNFGFFFVDNHGPRAWDKVEGDPTPYLGSQQWSSLESALSEGGKFDEVDTLLLLCPVPLLTVSPWVTHFLGRVHDDFLGHWGVAPVERIRFIEAVIAWRDARHGRDVLLVGGDIHMAGHAQVYKKGVEAPVLMQFVSSAVSQYMVKRHEFFVLTLATLSPYLGDDDLYTAKHSSYVRSNNIGVVEVLSNPNNNGRSHHIRSHVRVGSFTNSSVSVLAPMP